MRSAHFYPAGPHEPACVDAISHLRMFVEQLELLTHGDDNVVALKRRNKSAESLTA